MIAILLVFLMLPAFLQAQVLPENSVQFLKEETNDSNLVHTSIQEISKYDLSNLWLYGQNNLLGFIGNNYKRFYIRFISIIKDADKPNEYYVFGKTRVGNNVCSFLGKFEVLKAYMVGNNTNEILYEALKHEDKEAAERLKAERGFMLVKYNFYENPKQRGSGIFRGILKTNFVIKEGKILLDTLDLESDNYSNNLFVGIWRSYRTGQKKICNWGLYRIPFSDDLDIGAGYFSPNKKYWKYGWYNYYKAYIELDTAALDREKEKWWKK